MSGAMLRSRSSAVLDVSQRHACGCLLPRALPGLLLLTREYMVVRNRRLATASPFLDVARATAPLGASLGLVSLASRRPQTIPLQANSCEDKRRHTAFSVVARAARPWTHFDGKPSPLVGGVWSNGFGPAGCRAT